MARKRVVKNLAETIGSNITFERKKRGWSQSELAEKVNLSDMAISAYERAKRVPDCDVLVRLCNVFDVSSDYLLGVERLNNYDERLEKIEEKLNNIWNEFRR